MTKYKVHARVAATATLVVEADSPEQARQLAQEQWTSDQPDTLNWSTDDGWDVFPPERVWVYDQVRAVTDPTNDKETRQ